MEKKPTTKNHMRLSRYLHLLLFSNFQKSHETIPLRSQYCYVTGVPKETWLNEKRIALTPAATAMLVKKVPTVLYLQVATLGLLILIKSLLGDLGTSPLCRGSLLTSSPGPEFSPSSATMILPPAGPKLSAKRMLSNR